MVSLQAIFQTPASGRLLMMKVFFAAKHHGERAAKPSVSG